MFDIIKRSIFSIGGIAVLGIIVYFMPDVRFIGNKKVRIVVLAVAGIAMVWIAYQIYQLWKSGTSLTSSISAGISNAFNSGTAWISGTTGATSTDLLNSWNMTPGNAQVGTWSLDGISTDVSNGYNLSAPPVLGSNGYTPPGNNSFMMPLNGFITSDDRVY